MLNGSNTSTLLTTTYSSSSTTINPNSNNNNNNSLENDLLNDDLVDSTDELDDLIEDSLLIANDAENKNNSKLQNASNTGNSSSNQVLNNEDDKRKRRAIANSNERRRMQSINAGFQTLKSLIPHSCGEKLSKACILQRSADYMQYLNKEKEKLATKLQIALKLLESNGLLAQLQAQLNTESSLPEKTPVLTQVKSNTNNKISQISTKKSDSPAKIKSSQLTDTTNLGPANNLVILNNPIQLITTQIGSNKTPETCEENSNLNLELNKTTNLIFKILETFKTNTSDLNNNNNSSNSLSGKNANINSSDADDEHENDDDLEQSRIKTSRSSSIDQLIAAAAVSAQTDSANRKNLNLNTIFEAIKHVEGKNYNEDLESGVTHLQTVQQTPQADKYSQQQKPPKKRKYTSEDLGQSTNTPTPATTTTTTTTTANATTMCYIDLNQLNALISKSQTEQPILIASNLVQQQQQSTKEDTPEAKDKLLGLLVTSS